MDVGIGHNAIPVIERLELDYEELRAEITDALAALPEVQIASDEDILIARELVRPLKALQNKCAAAHKAEKAFYLDGGRQVDAYFKAQRVHLDAVIALITEEASEYQAKKLALAREQATSEARIAAMLEEPPPEPPKPAAMTRVNDGGAVAVSGAIRWDFEIVDEDALPRTLLQPNEVAIRACIAGLKATSKNIEDAKIPGLRIFEKVQTVFR